MPWYRNGIQHGKTSSKSKKQKNPMFVEIVLDLNVRCVSHLASLKPALSLSINEIVFCALITVRTAGSIAEIRFHATELRSKMHRVNNLISGFNLDWSLWLCFKVHVSWHAYDMLWYYVTKASLNDPSKTLWVTIFTEPVFTILPCGI